MRRTAMTTLLVLAALVLCLNTARAEEVSLLDYIPAKGCANDCTDAIQSAVNHVLANGGGVLYIPKGVYRVRSGSGIHIEGSSITLRGDGEGSQLKCTGSGPALTIGTGHTVMGVSIRDLAITRTTHTQAGILLLDQAVRYNIEGVTITGFKTGIQTTDRNHSGHIFRCNIYDNEVGIHLADRSQFTDITCCNIHHNSQYGISLRDCNVINIISSTIEENGRTSKGASIMSAGVDALNVIGCFNQQSQNPGAFAVVAKGNALSHAINFTGNLVGGKLFLSDIVSLSVIGNQLGTVAPVSKTSVTGVTWRSNNIASPLY